MHEDKTPNESALALRLKQTDKYVKIALVGILILCAGLFAYMISIKTEMNNALSTKQAIVESTIDSQPCKIYPDTPNCVQAREVAANPDKVLVPKDGKDGLTGPQGPQGRGVAGFDQASGYLIVTYTDGQTQNVGKVVGKDGATGPQGRGILSTDLQNGALIVNYSDNTSENLGIIVGPAGKDGVNGTNGTNGTNGVDGAPGEKGADGISVVDLKIDSTNTVQVYYSDGTIKPAGQLIINTIKYMICDASTNVLTIGMTDGTTFSANVQCASNTPTSQPVPTTATTSIKK
jgi:hypothetical protein